MSEDSSNTAYQFKLSLLEDANKELVSQINMQKQNNQALMSVVPKYEALQQENYTLSLHNQQLQHLLDSERKHTEELQNRKHRETKNLREELQQKCHEIQRLKIHHEKQIFRLNEELRQTKNQFRQKKNDNFDQMSKSYVSSYLVDLRPSEENSFDRSNRASQAIDRTANKSSISYCPRESSQIRGNKNYTDYSKEELKVAFKALNKANKNLREGSMEVSMLQERQSIIRKNGL